MPYLNHHSCRIISPGRFDDTSFRTIGEGKLSIIIGKLKGKDKTTTQAYRYPTEEWTEDEARKHCQKYGGTFEPAIKK